MKKHYIALLSAAVMMLAASCGGGGGGAGIKQGEPGSGLWVDPDVDGYISEDTQVRLEDNFAAAVNRELIKTFPEPVKNREGTLYESAKTLKSNIRAAINDMSVTSREAEELRTFVSLAENWDKRNSDGVEPLRRYIDQIESISSIAEMTEYLKSTEKNPFNLGPMMPADASMHMGDPTKVVLDLASSGFVFGTAEAASGQYSNINVNGLEEKIKNDERTEYILRRLGFEDKRIKEIIRGSYSYERLLADSFEYQSLRDLSTSAANKTRDEIQEIAGSYPLLEICDARGYGKAELLAGNIKMISGIGRNYTESRLPELKAYIITRLISMTENMLDREAYDKMLERNVSRLESDAEKADITEDDLIIEYITESGMKAALDQVYLDKFYPDNYEVDELTRIIDDIKGSYREMLLGEEWLSDSSRESALDKLDKMAVHAIRPDDRADYSDMHIKTAGEGGTLLDAAAESMVFAAKKDAELLSSGPIRTKWSIYESMLSTTQLNAMYHPDMNAFFIFAGYLQEPLFRQSMSYEEKLGAVGVTIAHEISHGFDENGSRKNAYGQSYEGDKEVDWMTMENRNEYEEKVNKLRAYFSLAAPLKFGGTVSGSTVSGEATADIAGMKAVLKLAARKPGFDYDKFFRAYARTWATRSTEDIESDMMHDDPHPLNYLRINITVQQYDEFLNTYGIKPGDGMYLEPERRVTVW